MIRNNSWLNVEIQLINLYPDEKKNISAYEDVFSKLLIMPESASDMVIILDKVPDPVSANGYGISVLGVKKDNPKPEHPLTSLYAIEFESWDKWLSMEIDTNATREFSEPEIIAHCLWEMTFAGFDENKIQGKLNKLTETAEAIEQMPEEEQKKLLTIDKLISALDHESDTIRKAKDGDEVYLTELSFASKKYWSYPLAYFTVWEPELTITKQYLSENEVFVFERGKEVLAYYSIVNLHEPLSVGEIELEKGFWLDHIFVKPENIGEGIGKRLFLHLVDYCKEHSIHEIKILAEPNSKGFFEKMGCDYVREYPSTIKNRTTPLMVFRL